MSRSGRIKNGNEEYQRACIDYFSDRGYTAFTSKTLTPSELGDSGASGSERMARSAGVSSNCNPFGGRGNGRLWHPNWLQRGHNFGTPIFKPRRNVELGTQLLLGLVFLE